MAPLRDAHFDLKCSGMSRAMWDERYGRPGFAYGHAPNDFLVGVADRLPSTGRALCLAEGEGRNAVFLAQRGLTVTAVDQSPVGLAKARTWAAEAKVDLETVATDLADFSIAPASFELIVAIWCHLPQPLRGRVHRDAVQGLVPGGVLVLEAYTPAQLALRTGGPPVPELLVTLAELRVELTGLELVHAAELVREVHEGEYHNGQSAVVQVIGIMRA